MFLPCCICKTFFFLCKNDDTKTTVDTAGKKQVWVLKSYRLYLNYTQLSGLDDLNKTSGYKTTTYYDSMKGDPTDKRTDVWSRNFMIWKTNFGLWAVAWARLWGKKGLGNF